MLETGSTHNQLWLNNWERSFEWPCWNTKKGRTRTLLRCSQNTDCLKVRIKTVRRGLFLDGSWRERVLIWEVRHQHRVWQLFYVMWRTEPRIVRAKISLEASHQLKLDTAIDEIVIWKLKWFPLRCFRMAFCGWYLLGQINILFEYVQMIYLLIFVTQPIVFPLLWIVPNRLCMLYVIHVLVYFLKSPIRIVTWY